MPKQYVNVVLNTEQKNLIKRGILSFPIQKKQIKDTEKSIAIPITLQAVKDINNPNKKFFTVKLTKQYGAGIFSSLFGAISKALPKVGKTIIKNAPKILKTAGKALGNAVLENGANYAISQLLPQQQAPLPPPIPEQTIIQAERPVQEGSGIKPKRGRPRKMRGTGVVPKEQEIVMTPNQEQTDKVIENVEKANKIMTQRRKKAQDAINEELLNSTVPYAFISNKTKTPKQVMEEEKIKEKNLYLASYQ